MIAASVVSEIRSLLTDSGLSQRKIARRLGVSRGTVNAIARGKRPDHAGGRPRSMEDWTTMIGPVARCPRCGGMVQMPCLACRIRAMQGRRRRSGGR